MISASQGLAILAPLAALGCAIVAGIFMPFSSFVLRGLRRLPPAQGAAAMRSINLMVAESARIVDPAFGIAFIGTTALTLAAAVMGMVTGAVYLVAACALFVLGNVVVTLVFNIPLNDALAAAEPGSADGEAVWLDFVRRWIVWNHVRVATALAAALLFAGWLRP